DRRRDRGPEGPEIVEIVPLPFLGSACPKPLIVDEDELLQRPWIPVPNGRDFDALSSESVRYR
ncbi:hypothetical protein TorRG33x02_016310, partial [Trema orientale]